MHKLTIGVLGLALLAATSAAALAEGGQPVRVRGEIGGIDGNTLFIKSRDGEPVMIKLTDNWAVGKVSPVTMAALKKGQFVGVAARPAKDGSLTAIEVLILPEALRGSNEGHYPWDLEPGSNMTNANVDATVVKKGADALSLSYKGGTQNIAVTKEAAVVALGPGDRSDVKPGAFAVVFATKGTDGMLTASRLAVGKDGAQPPM